MDRVRGAILFSIIGFAICFGPHVAAQSSKSKTSSSSKQAQIREVEVDEAATNSKFVNIFIQPIDLVLTAFRDITISGDVKVARFVTAGIDYRNRSGSSSSTIADIPEGTSLSGVRLRGDIYFSGQAFKDSFIAQLNYSFYGIKRATYYGEETASYSGPGVMLGWRWFWTDPGQSGLNVGLLLGGQRLSESGSSTAAGLLLDARIELGIAL